MIKTRDEFEAALETVMGHLADPPHPGSAEDKAFQDRLRDLAAYRRAVPDTLAPEHPERAGFDALDKKLSSFRERYPDHIPEGSFSQFGFGRDLKGGQG